MEGPEARFLEKVPDGSHTVLELAMAADEMTVPRCPADAFAQAHQYAHDLGFEYLSDVGTKPLGTKGGPDSFRGPSR